jgi:hypothetical protein
MRTINIDWNKLDGSIINVNGINMTVYDVCRSCHRLWAKNGSVKYFVRINQDSTYSVIRTKEE